MQHEHPFLSVLAVWAFITVAGLLAAAAGYTFMWLADKVYRFFNKSHDSNDDHDEPHWV